MLTLWDILTTGFFFIIIFHPKQLFKTSQYTQVMKILTLVIIVSSLAQAMILCKNVPIEYFPNDLGNDCFMRSFKPNILILLSKSDNECVGVWVRLALYNLS